MQEEMLTLEKFEEASEIVKKVTLETKLVSFEKYLYTKCCKNRKKQNI